MEEAAARPTGGPQDNRTSSSVEVTSTVEGSAIEPQSINGHLPRPWPCPQEDRTPSLMAPQPLRGWGIQLQGSSVLESKVRALKEHMITGKQEVSPCVTAHEQPSSKKPRCQRVKVGGARAPLPGAVMILHAQNPTERQLDNSVSEEEPARNGGCRPPRPPAPGLKCCNRRNLWTPETGGMLPDCERGLLPGPSSVQESPIHRVTPGQPRGPRACNKVTHMPNLRKGRSYPLRDDLVTEGDLDSLSPTSKDDFVHRPALLGGLWKAGDLGALGTAGSTLPLSERVERNRLLLQEMLIVAGQGLPKARIPAWTPSWDRNVPEQPSGDMDWDSGISLQDSDQNRTFGPKLEPVLRSPKHEEAKHLPLRTRVKARTRPLRASHDIMPAIDQGGWDGGKSPVLDQRKPFACKDNLQNGSTSDSSGGEFGGGQWPRRGPSPSHVRFEDESAREAESRYLERLQQRQRQVLSPALRLADQGPLRSKPELADYIAGGLRSRGASEGAPRRLVGQLGERPCPAPPPTRVPEGMCRACGSCMEDPRPALAEAAPGPSAFQEGCAASGLEAVLTGPRSSQGPGAPLRFLPTEQGLRTDGTRDTRRGDSVCSEDVDSALGSTDTDSCRTDSEEAGPSQPSRTGSPACGRGPRLCASRPRGGHRWAQKAEMEQSESPRAPHNLPGVDVAQVSDEVKEGRGSEGTPLPREDAFSEPCVQESGRPSLGSQGQLPPGVGNHCTMASLVKLASWRPGRQHQVIENRQSLETVPLQRSHAEPSAPHQAQQPAASVSSQGWVPTPPSSRKTSSPGSHRKTPRRPCDQGEPVDALLPPSRSVVFRTSELSPPQTQPCSPQDRHPVLGLSNNCNNSVPGGLQEPWEGAILEGVVEKGASTQEPEASLDYKDGVGTISSIGVTLSLALEEPESSQKLEGGLQRTKSSSEGQVSSRALPGISAGPGPSSAAPSDRNKKISGSITTLGLKKFFLALGQGTRPKLSKSCSYSVEQLQPPVPGPASQTSTPKVRRAPSLQSLRLVSPSHQHRKAASFQNLHSLLSGKVDRSSLYLVEEPGDHSDYGRLAKAQPRRALSVEDVGAPSLARTVGRLVEVFPDGTSQLQLQRSPEGTFGFCVASGNGRRDSGFYVQEMSDASMAKLYSGLLGVGDEILEVNGAKVAGLGLAHIKELLAHAESLSLRVLRQRPAPR